MVWNHVAQGACIVEVGASALNSDCFGVGDLYMVDVAAIPDGLEDGVVEAENHDVLHGLFAEIVIDAVDLVFLQDALDVAIQGLGGFDIGSEGLLDDDAAPASLVLQGEFCLA
jgi:hypothetical protein